MSSTKDIITTLGLKRDLQTAKLNKINTERERVDQQQQLFQASLQRVEASVNNKPLNPELLKNHLFFRTMANKGASACENKTTELNLKAEPIKKEICKHNKQVDIFMREANMQRVKSDKQADEQCTDEFNRSNVPRGLGV